DYTAQTTIRMTRWSARTCVCIRSSNLICHHKSLFDARADGGSAEIVSHKLEVWRKRRFSFKILDTRGVADVVLGESSRIDLDISEGGKLADGEYRCSLSMHHCAYLFGGKPDRLGIRRAPHEACEQNVVLRRAAGEE